MGRKGFKQERPFLGQNFAKAFDVKFAMPKVSKNMFGELHGVFRRD
jgi:hypothetical protein